MVGPRVLNATRSPTATFKSERVTGRATGSNAYDLTITGELSLHGVTRSVSLPLRVEIGGHTLKATGYVLLRQTECGISPVTVAAVVKVKDELTIDYVFVATKVIP
jgi:polyisoprenoid-binding protein YceI